MEKSTQDLINEQVLEALEINQKARHKLEIRSTDLTNEIEALRFDLANKATLIFSGLIINFMFIFLPKEDPHF